MLDAYTMFGQAERLGYLLPDSWEYGGNDMISCIASASGLGGCMNICWDGLRNNIHLKMAYRAYEFRYTVEGDEQCHLMATQYSSTILAIVLNNHRIYTANYTL